MPSQPGLAELPAAFCKNLEVVQLSGMTRKKQSAPLLWHAMGTSRYLYPIEDNLVEYYHCPPDRPAQRN